MSDYEPAQPMTGRYTILGVSPHRRNSQRFEIAAQDTKGLTHSWYTWNAFQATLCDQAQKLERPVTATVCDTWYGRELQDVTLAEELEPETKGAA